MSWRASAQRTIRATLAAHAGQEHTPEALLKLVNAAYPFGMRKHLPYKVWLEELQKLRVKLCGQASPIARPCPTCGAKPGRPCKSYDPDDPPIPELHASRRERDNGPLFATPESTP